jgi:predicted nucleic acid-binding protein
LELLDTTLLSNFARIGQLDLLITILPEAKTTPQVLAELDKGEAAGWLPESDWEWLGVVTLSANEQAHFEKMREVLGDGEASCLAVARERNGTIITDDRDARRYARRLGVAISGTLGMLALLVKRRILTLPEADSVLQAMIKQGYYSPVNSLTDIFNFGDRE